MYGACSGRIPLYAPLVIDGGAPYRLYQIPLHAFEDNAYSTFGTGLCEFGVGANWTDVSRVLVDEVRIRW